MSDDLTTGLADKFGFNGLTYDDVLLLSGRADQSTLPVALRDGAQEPDRLLTEQCAHGG